MSNEHSARELWIRLDDFFMNHLLWLYDFQLKHVGGKRLLRALRHIRGPRVLEVSFGVGFLMSHYADKFDVVGLDINPHCIELTKRRLAAKNMKAELVQGDAHSLPFEDESFDTLINTDAFLLYRDQKKVLSEFLRVLAPGGRLILLEYDDPKDNTPLGRIWASLARSLIKMPNVDFKGLFAGTGLPYEDYDVGGFGALHMFVMDKPLVDTTPERTQLGGAGKASAADAIACSSRSAS